jgi:hypothetical protein
MLCKSPEKFISDCPAGMGSDHSNAIYLAKMLLELTNYFRWLQELLNG